jgi:23S rRNA G2445 N2-methylase RlmL
MERIVRLHHGECREWQLPRRPALVVSNPPWGQRLRGRENGAGLGDGTEEVAEWFDDPEYSDDDRQADEARQEQQQRQPSAEMSRLRQEAAAEAEALRLAWWDLSAFLKLQAPGSKAFLLSGNKEATMGLRMKADRRHVLSVGGTDCRLLQYSIRGMPGAESQRA